MNPEQEKRIERIRRSIRALLAKTTSNGATEGEALAASELAAKLMSEWDIEHDDLVERPKDDLKFRNVATDPVMSDALWQVGKAIADLCHCRVWMDARKTSVFLFYGEDLDCEIAQYLMSVCERAVRDETRKADASYALYRRNVRHRKRLGFIDGMSTRLAERVSQLAWERQRAAKGALVPSKLARIDEAFEAGGHTSRPFDLHQSISDAEAKKEGTDRANAVPLNRGLERDEDHGNDIAAPVLLLDGAR